MRPETTGDRTAKDELEEWKQRLGYRTDEALAKAVGVERSTVTSWKRNGIPKPIKLLFTFMEKQNEQA